MENREIFIPHPPVFSAPRGVTRRHFVKMFDADKTRMIGLPYFFVKKNYDNTLSRFHPKPECDGETDKIAISISPVSVLTSDKNIIALDIWQEIKNSHPVSIITDSLGMSVPKYWHRKNAKR